MKLGVDFGTTRTVVAHADRGNYPVVSFLDERGDAHDFFPSVVAEKAGALTFGFEALASGESGSVVRSFKRLLSDPRAVPGTPVQVGGLTLGLGELIERFLVALREAIEHRSNLRPPRARAPRAAEAAPAGGASRGSATAEPVRCVVAVPANSLAAQRLVTLEAFRAAGFAPIALLNEPSAAGFEYTHRHRATLTAKRNHVVVYDLGGGTFDASLVRLRGERHEVLATGGLGRLGGDDFDDVLVDLVLDAAKVTRAELSPRTLGRLVDQCRDAKERLNPSSRKIAIELELEGGAGGAGESATAGRARSLEVSLPVASFYEACAPLVERTIEAMVPVMTRLETAAPATDTTDATSATSTTDAPVAPDDIAGIYVVGGASELPIVARALRERFGRRVHRSPYPSAAIAIGLAIACDDESGFELSDRYGRTFGVFREGAAGSEITFDPIFTSDTALPEVRAASGARPALRFKRDYRAAHNVGHFRFLECTTLDPEGRPRGDMTVSGDVLFPFDPRLAQKVEAGGSSFDLRAVKVERLDDERDGPHIQEEYSLDEGGIVAVKIRNVDLGYERQYRLGV